MSTQQISPAAHAAPLGADDMLRAFENCTLDPAQFTHRQHLSVAWTYLQRYGFPQGAVMFRERLQAYVASVGAAAKYHETITWAYIVLMNEELCLNSYPGESFDDMIQRRPDLLDHRGGAIARSYSRLELDQPAARRVFILPKRAECAQ